MGWWKLPGPDDEVMGDEAADAAVAMLAPLREREPRPTLNEVLDAIEAVLREAGPELVSGSLGGQYIISSEIERVRGAAPPDLVTSLADGLKEVAGAYHDNFKRPPTLREVVAAVEFVFAPRPGRYVRDHSGAPLDRLELAS